MRLVSCLTQALELQVGALVGPATLQSRAAMGVQPVKVMSD